MHNQLSVFPKLGGTAGAVVIRQQRYWRQYAIGGVEGGRDGVRMGVHVQVGGEFGVARVARELALSMAFFHVMAQLMAVGELRHAVPAASATPHRPFEPLNAFLVEVDDEVIFFFHIDVGMTPLDCRALWSGTNKNRDVSTGSLARPFAGSLAPHTRSLARSLRSLPRSWESEFLMSQNDLVLSHSASTSNTFLRGGAAHLLSFALI